MVHADSCSGAASFHLHKHIYIYIYIYIYIAVKVIQWLEICLSFGSSCFPIFIENAVHGCSESERFWKEAGNGAATIFRRCEQGNLFRAPYCVN